MWCIFFSCNINRRTCVTFGKNDQGQCGIGNIATTSVLLPTAVELGDYQASYCACGWEHTLLITNDGY